MKRNTSCLSLQKMKYSRVSDNESEVSRCSRTSRHSSRSQKCRHTRGADDSGTESDSSRKRRHRRKHYAPQEQPQLVAWNDITEKRNEAVNGPSTKQSSAVVRNVTSFYNGDATNEPNEHLSGRQPKLAYISKPYERNGYIPAEIKKYIHKGGPVDSSHLSELEKRDIKFTNVEYEMLNIYHLLAFTHFLFWSLSGQTHAYITTSANRAHSMAISIDWISRQTGNFAAN